MRPSALGGGFDYRYNVNAATDATGHIIVAAELTNNGADSTRLPPLLEAVKHTAVEYPRQLLADAGFRSEAVFEELRGPPTELVVALGREGKNALAIDPQRRPLTLAMAQKFKTKETELAYRVSTTNLVSTPRDGFCNAPETSLIGEPPYISTGPGCHTGS